MEKYQKTAAQMAEDKRDKVVIDLRKEQEYKNGNKTLRASFPLTYVECKKVKDIGV